jgi:phytoene synthase
VCDPAAIEVGSHVGIAYSLAGLLRAMPLRARQIIPADIAARNGVIELAAVAARHLDAARVHRKAIPRSALPALLLAIIAQRSLARLKRAGYNPFDPGLATPDPLQSWRLAAAALFNRF